MEKVAIDFQEEHDRDENLTESKKTQIRMLQGIQKAWEALGGDTET